MIPVFIIIFLFFVILPYIIMWKRVSKGEYQSLMWLLKNGGKRLPFSTTKKYGMGEGLIYCPHPFTNWSLNPTYKNRFGENVHTVEGFRKIGEVNSIVQLVQENPDSYKIICVGGSTTYCTDIVRYQDTWPARLSDKLSGTKTLVFNFGVGGWGTLQSLVRCLTWFPIIRPNLLVFYQAKNDLTPLYNGTEKEKKIYPDYQNIMGQFSESFSLISPRWLLYLPLFSLIQVRRLRGGLLNIYKPKPWANPEGLCRLDDEIIEGVLFRTEALFNLCKMINCNVLYIPEIVRSGEYFTVINKIYERIPEILDKYTNVSFLDVRDVFPDTEQYYFDKMHFNEKGCELFAELLSRQIRRYLK